MKEHNHLIIIFGPTGVGKSNFAEQLANSIPSEIVNMDLGQFYTPLSIGTAKPDWQKAPIKHHLFDILGMPQHYSVIDYRLELIKTVQEIWQQKKIPIVVGGSTLYAKSIFFPPTAPPTPRLSSLSKEDAWNKLYAIDPLRASKIDKHDMYRISKALAIWESTGKKPSDYITVYNPITPNFTLIFANRGREDLYSRINKRVACMIERGWLQEVAALVNTPWEEFLHEKKFIGYNEILDYIKSNKSNLELEKTIAAIAQRTRHYAKRQQTFWNMLERELSVALSLDTQARVETINLTTLNTDLYIKHLSDRLIESLQ